MDDEELVLAARAGDTAALVAIYDRYADGIHDFSITTVRNRADAAAVTHDTFLVAFEWLDQLRQPSRLRPWLYAIAYNAALRRIAAGSRPSRPEQMAEDLFSPASPDERMSRAQLAEFVWMAAGHLGDRDRALLDLHLRQGLEDGDLAHAIGVSPADLPVVLDRLLAQAERSLGALLVARTSGRNCAQLSEILGRSAGWLAPELWDRVTAHVDDCEICNSRRRRAMSPIELMGRAPAVPAPASLRGVVLGRSGRAGSAAGWLFSQNGFPYQGGDAQGDVPTGVIRSVPSGTQVATPVTTGYSAATTTYRPPRTYRPAPPPPPRGPQDPDRDLDRDRDRRGVVLGALAGLIILIGGITAFVATRGNGPSKPVSVLGAPTTLTTTTAIPTPVPTSTLTATTMPSVSTTAIAGPGRLVVGVAGIDFGVTAVNQSLVVGNNGGSSITFTATPSSPLVTITPASTTIDPNMSDTLKVTLDRATAPSGRFSGTIVIASEGGSATVTVTAVIDPGPGIAGETATPTTIARTLCPFGPTISPTSTITATVSGPVAVKTVTLHWQAPNSPGGSGVTGNAPMMSNGSTFSGPLGPFTTTGTAQWWIVATDTSGVTAMSMHHSVTVNC